MIHHDGWLTPHGILWVCIGLWVVQWVLQWDSWLSLRTYIPMNIPLNHPWNIMKWWTFAWHRETCRSKICGSEVDQTQVLNLIFSRENDEKVAPQKLEDSQCPNLNDQDIAMELETLGKIIKTQNEAAWSPKATPQPPTLFKLEKMSSNSWTFMAQTCQNMS